MCILEPCGAAIKNAASLPAKEGTIFQVRNYVIKRILLSFVILFCVTFIIYVMMRSLPSSFAENMAMQLSQAPGAKPYQEWLDQLNAAYGLDKGILPGFMTWLSSAVHGQFGDSWKWNVPVVQKFQEVIGLSVVMGGISFVVSMIIAVPLGILAATKQYSRTDYVITAVALVGISLPSFFFATLLSCCSLSSLAGLTCTAWSGVIMPSSARGASSVTAPTIWCCPSSRWSLFPSALPCVTPAPTCWKC